MPKKAIGPRIKFPGRAVAEPNYLQVKFFKMGDRIFLDYIDVRLDIEDKVYRYRPIVTGSFSGDFQVEMRRIQGGGEMSDMEKVKV